MCDSLGDSNQAEVHFLGIGSQLRGAALPQVIKHSQAVIHCTTAIAANSPPQKREPCPAQRGRTLGILPLCTIYGVHGTSGTCVQTWVTEQTTPVMLLAVCGDNTVCKAGVSPK